MSLLFSPLSLRSVTLPNRVVLSPMCQYSAIDGSANDWHLAHLGQYAMGGVGLAMVEATGVSPEGRITPGCLGLWSDENEAALKQVLGFYRRWGSSPIGIQLAHAGRKASSNLPWKGGKALTGPEAWQTLGPSALAYDDSSPAPLALDEAGLAMVKRQFVQAAERALRLGFDLIEVHSAHGYLLHSFLSPLSNQRNDGYGGTREGRMRFPLEVFEALRAVWPADKPLGLRLSASDFVGDEGWTLADSIAYAQALKGLGCDFVDVSGGGLSPRQQIKAVPGYQVPFARAIREATGLPTLAVGMILEPKQAEAILAEGSADMVALARGFLRNPRWTWDAADELGAESFCPPQYLRARRTVA